VYAEDRGEISEEIQKAKKPEIQGPANLLQRLFGK
jgi:hypothetical protein